MTAPITLTRAQFAKTPAAQQGGTFEMYKHFLAVHRARLGLGPDGRKLGVPDLLAGHPAAAAVDPLAPNPNIARDASAAVHAQIDPYIRQVGADFNRRTTAGTSAITAGTKTLMDAFAQYAPAEKQAYEQAVGQTSSLNTALANRLQGVGTGLQGELQQKLAAINAPGAQQQAVAVGTGAIGAGAANAGFARGAANISDLIAREAAARDYGAKLPGVAARMGATNLRNLAAQTESDRAKALGDIRARVPGLISSTLGQLRTEELNKALFQAGIGKQQTAEAAQTARTQAQIDAANARANASNATRASVANANATNKQTAAAQKATVAASKTALSIIQKAAKVTVNKPVTVTTPAGKNPPPFDTGKTKTGTTKTVKTQVVPLIGSEAYYRAVHQAEAAIAPLVPDWPPQKVTAFVQQLANKYFKQPPKPVNAGTVK